MSEINLNIEEPEALQAWSSNLLDIQSAVCSLRPRAAARSRDDAQRGALLDAGLALVEAQPETIKQTVDGLFPEA